MLTQLWELRIAMCPALITLAVIKRSAVCSFPGISTFFEEIIVSSNMIHFLQSFM